MKLAEMKVQQYLDVLSSDAPAPGGGSASALSGAQGMALTLMVANLTNGREKYAEFFSLCEDAIEKGTKVYNAFSEGIDKDTEAFNQVSAAYKMPKETDEQKLERSKAIAAATLVATEVPFETMELCREALQITESLVGKSNPNASSDIGVAALNIKSCLLGAWLNVKINLPSIKEADKKSYYEAEGQRLVAECSSLADKIYQEILDLY